MHQAPPQHEKPSSLSAHDPPPDTATTGRPPVLLIIVLVALVIGFVVLHLTGVFGPGSH